MSWASTTWKLSKGWWPLVWHWWPRLTGKLKRFTAVRCAVLSWKQEPFKPRFALWDAKRLERSPQSSPWQGSTKGVGNAVKLIGAGLVLFSGLLAGILAAARLQRRARLLLDWMTLLGKLSNRHPLFSRQPAGVDLRARTSPPGFAAWRNGTGSSS